MSHVSRHKVATTVMQVLLVGAPVLPLISIIASRQVIWGILWGALTIYTGWKIADGLIGFKEWALALFFGGVSFFWVMSYVERSQASGVMVLLWVLLWLGASIALPILEANYGGAVRRDATKAAIEAKKKSVAERRERELKYAERIERQRNSVARASGPGELTGFEPQALAAVTLEESPNVHGDPGAGLAGSDFSASAVSLGQQGELNFAKTLQVAGLLNKFQSFWSVHMPDDDIGASTQFMTDIDCVLVSGTSVWLVDVKNYAQGDVTWRIEESSELGGSEKRELVMIDNQSGGYVGKPRQMSRNMELAQDRFRARFSEAGISYDVKSAVVMMPRNNGIGTLDNVSWPGGIPAVALPHLLFWLGSEPPFDPYNQDARLVTSILSSLLKDESGSAMRLGQMPTRGQASTSSRPNGGQRSTPPPPPPPPAAAPVAPPVPAPPVAVQPSPNQFEAAGDSLEATVEAAVSADASPERTCSSCGAKIEEDWKFCYECGASF